MRSHGEWGAPTNREDSMKGWTNAFQEAPS